MDRAQRAALLEAVDALVRTIPTHPAVLRVQRVVTSILAKEESVQPTVISGAPMVQGVVLGRSEATKVGVPKVSEGVVPEPSGSVAFDKAAYQREYMRKKRVEAKAARAAAKGAKGG